MSGSWQALTVPPGLILLALFVVPAPAEEAESFSLTEASIFDDSVDAPVGVGFGLKRVQAAESRIAQCRSTPSPGVVYPPLHSRTPWYGCLDVTGATEDWLYFAIDESQPAGDPPAADGITQPSDPANADAGKEKDSAAPIRYDRLYVDLNGDRDLTNDPPLGLLKERPKMFLGAAANASVVLFEYFDIKRAATAPSPAMPVRVLAWLIVGDNRPANLVMMTATVRTGRVRIGDAWYEALVGTPLRGPAVRAMIRPELTGTESPGRQAAWRVLSLGTHQVKRGFFEVSLSSSGDRITVAPYSGAMGQLQVDPGDRPIRQCGAAGLLQSATGSNVWLGEPENYYSEERPRECRLPVGDYRASFLSIAMGDLLVRLSANPQRVPVAGNATSAPAGFPIAIRSDKPCTLRFAPQPTMIFTSPPPDSSRQFRRGTTIAIKAQLLDPGLDCLIRGLDDTAEKTGEAPYRGSSGETRTIAMYASIVPRVSITNAAGKEIAGGPMPFG